MKQKTLYFLVDGSVFGADPAKSFPQAAYDFEQRLNKVVPQFLRFEPIKFEATNVDYNDIAFSTTWPLADNDVRAIACLIAAFVIDKTSEKWKEQINGVVAVVSTSATNRCYQEEYIVPLLQF